MKTYLLRQLLITLISMNTLLISAQTKDLCKNSITYDTFQYRWNDKVKTLTVSNWKIPKTFNINSKQDPVIFIQLLDGSNLSLIATISKTKCLKKVVIKAKRDINIGYASLVAWLAVIKVFNPELSNEDRISVLDELGITKAVSISNLSTLRNNNMYFFDENSIGNTFTVTPVD